jgi:hypothetical protein
MLIKLRIYHTDFYVDFDMLHIQGWAQPWKNTCGYFIYKIYVINNQFVFSYFSCYEVVRYDTLSNKGVRVNNQNGCTSRGRNVIMQTQRVCSLLSDNIYHLKFKITDVFPYVMYNAH